MSPARGLIAWGCLFLLVSPLVGAGTPQQPDITDPADDVQLLPGGLVANVASPEIDILAVWVEADPGTVRATLRIQDLGHRIHADESLFFSITFHSEQYRSAAIEASYAFGAWRYLFSGTRHDGTSTGVLVPGQADASDGRIVMEIPRGLLDSTMLGTKASSILALHAPVGSGTIGGGQAWFRDWAPDEGPGVTIPIE